MTTFHIADQTTVLSSSTDAPLPALNPPNSNQPHQFKNEGHDGGRHSALMAKSLSDILVNE